MFAVEIVVGDFIVLFPERESLTLFGARARRCIIRQAGNGCKGAFHQLQHFAGAEIEISLEPALHTGHIRRRSFHKMLINVMPFNLARFNNALRISKSNDVAFLLTAQLYASPTGVILPHIDNPNAVFYLLDALRSIGRFNFCLSNFLSSQIFSAERSGHDDRVAKAREHIEAVQENIAMFEARLAEESAQVEAYVDELRAQLVEAQEKLLAAQEVRDEKAKPLQEPGRRRFLDYYDRLRKKYFPVVFRVREGNGCPGCHMVLPASKMQEAQRNAKLADTPEKMNLVACDYCGRLIFK